MQPRERQRSRPLIAQIPSTAEHDRQRRAIPTTPWNWSHITQLRSVADFAPDAGLESDRCICRTSLLYLVCNSPATQMQPATTYLQPICILRQRKHGLDRARQICLPNPADSFNMSVPKGAPFETPCPTNTRCGCNWLEVSPGRFFVSQDRV